MAVPEKHKASNLQERVILSSVHSQWQLRILGKRNRNHAAKAKFLTLTVS